MRFITLAAAVAAAVAAAPAEATSTRDLDHLGFKSGSRNVSAAYSGGAFDAAAGGFEMKDRDSGEKFVAWCIDVANLLRDPHVYDEAAVLTTPQLIDVQKLFDANYESGGVLDSARNSAAFQLAIWDAIYDDDWDVDARAGSGGFEVLASGASYPAPAGVVSRAQHYLDAAKSHDLSGGVTWLLGQLDGSEGDPASQSLINASKTAPIGEVAPIPAPAGVLLIGSAFGLAAWRGRAGRG